MGGNPQAVNPRASVGQSQAAAGTGRSTNERSMRPGQINRWVKTHRYMSHRRSWRHLAAGNRNRFHPPLIRCNPGVIHQSTPDDASSAQHQKHKSVGAS